MYFHQELCEVIHITTNKKAVIHKYALHGNTLSSVPQIKYLDVHISQDLKWNSHINSISSKANQKLLERTNNIYAVLLQGSGQCLRFRFRKANILFAFLVFLVRWGSHLRSSDIKIPKRGLCFIFCSIWLFSV